MYLITEPYDGIRVRILASSRTREGAEKQFARIERQRLAAGHSFFSPVRRIVGDRIEVENARDRHLVNLETW